MMYNVATYVFTIILTFRLAFWRFNWYFQIKEQNLGEKTNSAWYYLEDFFIITLLYFINCMFDERFKRWLNWLNDRHKKIRERLWEERKLGEISPKAMKQVNSWWVEREVELQQFDTEVNHLVKRKEIQPRFDYRLTLPNVLEAGVRRSRFNTDEPNSRVCLPWFFLLFE